MARTKQRRTKKNRQPTTSNTTVPLVLVQPRPKTAEPTPETVVDTRPKLPVRRKLFVGPMGPHEQASIRAALAAARTGLPVPVRAWDGSQAQLADGTLLIHNPSPDRTFTAHIACRHGSIHGYPITTATDLKTARAVTRGCERRHIDPTPGDNGIHLDWNKAIARGIQPTTRLADGLTTAKAAVADTQPLSQAEIADHIAAQLAHQTAEQTKEHPDHA